MKRDSVLASLEPRRSIRKKIKILRIFLVLFSIQYVNTVAVP